MKGKKLFIFLIALFFLSALVFAQSITVASPHSGDTWYKGKTYTIQWTKTGTVGNFVKIKLRNSTSTAVVLDIKSQIPNNGNYNWLIPASVPPGNYVIRVRTMDNKVSGDSGAFLIGGKISPASSISIKIPNSGSSWCKGKMQTIIWAKTGQMSGTVKINIFKNAINSANLVKQLTSPNSGSKNWTIPISYSNGKYLLRIKTVDNIVSGDSQPFTVKSCGSVTPNQLKTVNFNKPNWQNTSQVLKSNPNIFLASQLIRFYSPKYGYKWVPLKNYTISWTAQKSNFPYSSFNFRIKLISVQTGQPVLTISDDWLDPKMKRVNQKDHFAYSYNFKFLGSYNVPDGKYKILVESMNNSTLKGYSKVFLVKTSDFSNNTGFLGESNSDLSLESVFYNDFKKAIFAVVRNTGFGPYNEFMSINYSFTFGQSTYNDKNCPGNTVINNSVKFNSINFYKQEAKTIKLMDWHCFDKRPGDYLPKSAPIKYSVNLFSKAKKGVTKTGILCRTKKSDIIVKSPIFIYNKQNTVIRVGPNLKGTISPGNFNWIDNKSFKTKVGIEVWNWGCSSRTFNINLHMDGPYLNGKNGITIGTLTLQPGEQKHFESQPILFTILKGPKYQKLLLVADQPEKSNEGYQNSYMNNFILAYIRIYQEDNTVRGVTGL